MIGDPGLPARLDPHSRRAPEITSEQIYRAYLRGYTAGSLEAYDALPSIRGNTDLLIAAAVTLGVGHGTMVEKGNPRGIDHVVPLVRAMATEGPPK